jgi:hypothetical protein
MKTLKRNQGIIAIAAILLLLSGLLVTGCESDIPTGESYTPPAGMGAVRLNLNRTGFRTITTDTTIADFDEIVLTIYDSGGIMVGSPTSINPDPDTGICDPIPLDPDFYRLEVTALIGFADAAYWESSTAGTYTVEVTLNKIEPVDVVLKGIVDGIGQGTFAWDITDDLSIAIVVAKIDFQQLGGSSSGSLDLTGPYAFNDSEDFDSGFYVLDFVFEIADTSKISFRQILHIYNELTSTFTYTLTDSHFGITSGSIEKTVTFENWGTDIELEGDNIGAISEDDIITLLDTDIEVITFVNADKFTSIVWTASFKGSDISGDLDISDEDASDDTLTIEVGALPFEDAGLYYITVYGMDADDAYTSISFCVLIE